MTRRVRFSRWTGTQDPFAQTVAADDVLDALSEDLLRGADLPTSLEALMRRGLTGRGGLDDLRRRVEEARRRELARMGLEGPLHRVAEALDGIVGRERATLDRLTDRELASAQHEQLDALPDDVAGRLAGLREYEWQDAGAAQEFGELLERLRRDVAEATFGRLSSALQATGKGNLARLRDLLADLNAMIAKRDRGEDIGDDYEAFRQRYPSELEALGSPATLDELLAELARRMAAMDALLAGLEPEQRDQLARLAGDLLGDLDLAFEAQQLQQALRRQFPELVGGRPVADAPVVGAEDASMSDTVDWVEHLQELTDLRRSLEQRYPGARLEDVDEEALRRALGEEGVRDLRALRDVERVLEDAGAARRRRGRWELTPRGIRRIGERSLARIFERTTGGPLGGHRTSRAGGDGELTGSTRPLRFGDPVRLDIPATIGNALRRGGARDRERGVRLEPGDFELAEAEQRVRVSTVLLLDMSFSMPLRGNWVPAKRVALALQSLIASRFPQDWFSIVGFSDYARELQVRDLFAAGWERVYGTNMQHAFMVARRMLDAHPGTDRQVIMITDGEPTAHLEGERPFFAWPPEPKTLRLTLAEATRLSKAGATLNVFLLDHDPGVAPFIEHMVRFTSGRLFYPDLDTLGSLVVRDFLTRRQP